MASEHVDGPSGDTVQFLEIPSLLRRTDEPHRDEPAQVAKRVAELEATVETLFQMHDEVSRRLFAVEEELTIAREAAAKATAPDPLADPPKMLRGRDKGEKR